jgi:hypothetical protein
MTHPYPTRIACANIEEKHVRVTVQIHDMPALGLTPQPRASPWVLHADCCHIRTVGLFVIRELKDDMRFSADEEKSFELKTCGSASQTGKHM